MQKCLQGSEKTECVFSDNGAEISWKKWWEIVSDEIDGRMMLNGHENQFGGKTSKPLLQIKIINYYLTLLKFH